MAHQLKALETKGFIRRDPNRPRALEVFLPDVLAAQEPAGTWELGRVAIVLAMWCAAGLALCVLTFRWQDRGTD